MKLKRMVASVILALVVSSASAASTEASIIITTYTGTVRGGLDFTGAFGGGDLAGDSFIAVYRTDTAVPDAINDNAWDYTSISGGARVGTSSPTSAIVTIKSGDSRLGSLAFSGSYYGQTFKSILNRGGLGASIQNQTYNNDGSLYLFNNISGSQSTGPAFTLDPYYWTPWYFDASAFGFYGNQTLATIGGIYGLGQGVGISFVTDTVTVSAVPEPATWAPMLVGFGLLGAVLRRFRARLRALRPGESGAGYACR